MKDGVMIVNTSRGSLIDTQAAIDALNSVNRCVR
ncbi:fermentative D-lactate dehydrogenase, NAD-dependent [Haemophilus influenzae]|uniref:Fermentative D-lactate dehydrogenase, NAD-dependent n=1 Tax=Haemophilus influenzae TaxID=727 RepID=A0A2X1PLT0_HAEIF|nr:fermentative D-lactate dehydrogenase, NAD-dependent [Haemophilus influenzae]